jgi:trans-aconitate methyltransferase
MMDLLNQHIKDFSKLNTLEVGIGDAIKSINRSPPFKSYTGLEPNKSSYTNAQNNCIQHNTPISLINTNLEDYNTTDKFDLIIFVLAFHFLNDKEAMFNKCLDMLDSRGVIYIEEFKAQPDERWEYPNFDLESRQFDYLEWTQKTFLLRETNIFLLQNLKGNPNVNVNYYDLENKDIYIITKN